MRMYESPETMCNGMNFTSISVSASTSMPSSDSREMSVMIPAVGVYLMPETTEAMPRLFLSVMWILKLEVSRTTSGLVIV